MRWLARCGLLLQILHTIQLVSSSNDSWGGTCPPGCICHITTYADLPMKKWLHEGTTQIGMQDAPLPHHINEVVYPEDEVAADHNTNEQLKMAMCIIQKASDVDTMFASMPKDVQVLTILQSRGSGDVYLEAKHMQSLELVALDIQGFHQDTYNKNMSASPNRNQGNLGKIIVRSDTFQSLSSLQYLNLQYVKILGNPNLGNRPAPVIHIADSMKEFSNSIPIGAWSKDDLLSQNNQYPNNIPSQLVLLQPIVSNINEEIVPYKVYKEEQERAGISVFSTLHKLLFLRVHGCGLKEVNWEMFTGLQKLEYLSLEKNHLLFIPDFTFYGTNNLRTLSLAHNKLLSLQSTGLAGLLDLEKLDLSYNNFSHLSELSLPPFPKLQEADFRGNPIQEVFASTFEIMNATKGLCLGSKTSKLTIQTNAFLGLDSLVKLNLFNVDVLILERDLLRGMPELQQLTMQGSIESLSFDAFLETPKLENLVLKTCSIKTVSMDTFYGLYGLLYLDLSHNLIESLPPGVFDQQFSLKELHLQNNLLTELPLNIFSNIPAKMIRLTGNPWECTCAMRDWKPAVINSRKQQTQEFCQFQYDKGSSCSQLSEQYVYDRTISPRCTQPAKFKNWSVFTALRKQLHCNTEKHAKFHRKEYLKKKHEEYEMSLNTKIPLYNKNKNSRLKQESQQTLDKDKNKKTLILQSNSNENVKLEDATNDNLKTQLFTENELTNLKKADTNALSHKTTAHENDSTTNKQKNGNTNNLATPVSINETAESRQTISTSSTKTITSINSTVHSGKTNYEQNLYKNKLEKWQRFHDKAEQTKKRERLKKESTYVVYNNKKPMKVSKKSWKLELEKTRQAKLKQAQIKKT